MKKKTPKKRKTQKRLIDKPRAFLAAFAECASLTGAAEATGIDRGAHYDWLEKDPAYAEAFAVAKRQAGDRLRDHAVEWATKGIAEPLVYQGKFCFAQRERVKCELPDGREIYEDEFKPSELARMQIQGKRTVVEPYGPPLVIYRRSEGLLARAWKAFLPDDSSPGAIAIELIVKPSGSDDE